MKNRVEWLKWGMIDYQVAWDKQSELLEQSKAVKLGNRGKSAEQKEQQRHYFITCQHPHVYTLGKSGSEDHLLLNDLQRAEHGVSYYKINRGGDITYHGPGQLVGYPILDLDEFFTDVHKYVRYIEEVIIRTLADFDIKGQRLEGFTGVWLDKGTFHTKICAIGVHLSRWITMHGFALNVHPDLNYFNHIVPCGIVDTNKKVTSMADELNTTIDLEAVEERISFYFQEIFNCNLIA